ncbi:hypothetical protein [Candidatus Nitronereus thalassa]|uniref:Uncharacterized protein n=1 Tax=Candidatus Nitronereus thalassa TaxID=3020898 RepID=A0ABU3K5U8_9BACT|nr:hypothetical protein [Candidatus Nitronereus thalassa]MDT7041737.1 hypothetical protein [Candidatus Nitronereus thalassa]
MQFRKQWVFTLFIAIVLFAGCGNETSTQTPSVPETQEEEGRVDPSSASEDQPAGEDTVSETPEPKD